MSMTREVIYISLPCEAQQQEMQTIKKALQWFNIIS